MFTVIDPQPKEDISFWPMMWSEDNGCWGLVHPLDSKPEFIPLPAGVDPAGVAVVKRNNLWFWTRPAYFNLSNPKCQVFKTLAPLGVFDECQMRLIANCVNYQQNDPAGLVGHQVNVLTAKLYVLLNLALALIDDSEEKKGIVEAYRVIML